MLSIVHIGHLLLPTVDDFVVSSLNLAAETTRALESQAVGNGLLHSEVLLSERTAA